MSIIYKTTNLVNGKIYVGQHFTSADDGYLGSGKWIKRAIKKYRKENFIREIIEFCTSANVDDKEVYWIDKLNATNPEVGYNISNGGKNNGMLGLKHSEKSRKKISLNHKRYSGKENPNFGNGQKIQGNLNPNNKWIYQMSNSENFFTYFKLNTRFNIYRKFTKTQSNKITYNGITIERFLKDFKGESNG